MCKHLTVCLVSLLPGSCVSEEEAVGPATTGIYDLEVSSLSDTCTPALATGHFRVGLFRDATALAFDIPVDPGGTGVVALQRVELGPTLRETYEQDLSGVCQAGRYSRVVEVTGETPNSVEAVVRDAWSDLIGCPVGLADDIPEADCESERRLDHALETECEEPCQVVTDADRLECLCPRAEPAPPGARG